MNVKAKRLFCSPIYGNVNEGDVLKNISEQQAKQLKDAGLVDYQEQAPKAPVKKTTKKAK